MCFNRFDDNATIMDKKELRIEYTEYTSPLELPEDSRALLEKAGEACENAYSPYSRFRVGAALQCRDGRIVTGNNQENAAYPSGLCAERVAIFSAMAQDKNTIIEKLAITVKTNARNTVNPVSPCGACRQVIAEYEYRQGSKIKIIFSSESGRIIETESIDALLPFTFNADFLPEN